MSETAGGYGAGLRIGVGLAASVFVLGVTFGALARSDGWGTLAPVVASVTVFSGSAQFVLVTALAGSGVAWTAIAAAGLINLRYLPMAVAVTPALKGGRLRKALESQAVTDGGWVVAHRGGDSFDREVLVGAALAQWPAWIAGTVLGAVLAPSVHLVHDFGLDVVFPVFFVVLLIDEIKISRRAQLAALSGGVIAALLLLVLPTGPALLGGSTAALFGLLPKRRSQAC